MNIRLVSQLRGSVLLLSLLAVLTFLLGQIQGQSSNQQMHIPSRDKRVSILFSETRNERRTRQE